MVQIDSLNIDTAASIRQAVAFQTRAAGTQSRQKRRILRESGARVVVGDIPPLAFAAAARGRHPVGRDRQFHVGLDLRGYRDARPRSSSRASIRAPVSPRRPIALRLPWPAASKGSSRLRATSRSSRGTRGATQDDVRRALGLPPRAEGKPLVLMSFGGYGVAGLDTPRSGT